MWTRLWLFVEQHSRVVIVVFPTLAFLLGATGWKTTAEMDWWTAAYRSMALFALDGPTGGDISWPLAWARFLAPITISLAIVAVALEVLRTQFAKGRAKRQRGHTVVLGSGPEATQIARRARQHPETGTVVSVGELPPHEVAELRRAGIIHLFTPDSSVLAKVLGGAKQVVISGRDDKEALTLTDQVQRLLGDAPVDVTTLLSDRELARDWRYTNASRVLCRSARVASAVLRDHPPYVEDAITPPPVVIGEGRPAAELARRIVEGWQRPGEGLTVHCAGSDPAWADTAQIGLAGKVKVVWHPLYPSAHMAPQVVREILGQWQQAWRRYRHNGRYHDAPARVYVLFEDDSVTMPIANAVARELPSDTYVVAVLDASTSTLIRHPGVRAVGRQELLCDPGDLRRTTGDELADEIVAELARWPDDVPSAFGSVVREPGHAALLSAQEAPLRDAVVAVAENAEAILEDAGLNVTIGSPVRSEVLVLDPSELVAVANKLTDLVPAAPANVTTQEHHARLLELGSALPTLLRRVGRSVVRADGRADLLRGEDVTALAMSAHKGYQKVARTTGNPTGSVFANAEWEQLTEHERRSNIAQILDIPVKLAALGLGWEAATPNNSASTVFTGAAIEWLAELEHRRWAHFEMRNARHGHQWNKPWASIKDDPAADHDREACRRVPGYLAQIGIRIVAIDDAGRAALHPLAITDEPAAAENVAADEDRTPCVAASGRRFRRRGHAWAWRLDGPFEWRSPRGDALRARTGDWWVVDADGSSRTVAADSFSATYEQVLGQEYRRVGVVTARQATAREVVHTREGDATAHSGDWVVTDAEGAIWPVRSDEFEVLYEEER